MTDRPADYGTPAEALRLMKEPMPEGFKWDFTQVLRPLDCGSAGCAIGELWLKTGGYPQGKECDVDWVKHRFGFSPYATDLIFLNGFTQTCEVFYWKRSVFVTRDDVIRALERYVATGKLDGG